MRSFKIYIRNFIVSFFVLMISYGIVFFEVSMEITYKSLLTATVFTLMNVFFDYRDSKKAKQ